jgi:hypothetical protein
VPGLLAWFAQARVRNVYEEYGGRRNSRGVTGLEAAKQLLAHHGLSDVTVERAEGRLTDRYDPEKEALHLTESVANTDSVTALGIVAHEVAHAVQDAEGYRLMRARTKMGQRLSVAARWGSFAFIGGMLFDVPILMVVSGVFLAALTVFALVTLPVERNASKRALAMLEETGLAADEERQGVQRVLRSAALTYLTSLGHRLATFLFFAVTVGAALGLWNR